MHYNAVMADHGRKLSIWFSQEQMDRLDAVMANAHRHNDRAKLAEVIKELMGFSPQPDIRPVITQEDRKIIAHGVQVPQKIRSSP